MKPRKLTLDSGIWRYLIDKIGVVTLWSPSGKRYKVGPAHTFTRSMCSCPPQHQCFGKGFSPGSLRDFIEKHVLEVDKSPCYGCSNAQQYGGWDYEW